MIIIYFFPTQADGKNFQKIQYIRALERKERHLKEAKSKKQKIKVQNQK